jgi:DNA-binding SARP family transcriptional activator
MLSISLFGPTVGVIDGRTVSASEMGGVKPRQILEILACNLGTSVTKDQLADQLWEDRAPASYVGTLESYVCVLRRNLGVGAEDRHAFLKTTPHGYLLDPEHVRVDLAEHRRLMSLALDAEGESAVRLTESALALVTGELLTSEPYSAWAVRARQAFQDENVEICVRAAQLASAAGDHTRGVSLARRAFGWDPLSEDAGQQLMRSLWSAGRRSQALRVYAQLRQALLDELGDEPGRESQELYLAILRDPESTRRGAMMDAAVEIKVLLRLLRQAIDQTPGLRAPASDARLYEVAVSALLVG